MHVLCSHIFHTYIDNADHKQQYFRQTHGKTRVKGERERVQVKPTSSHMHVRSHCISHNACDTYFTKFGILKLHRKHIHRMHIRTNICLYIYDHEQQYF